MAELQPTPTEQHYRSLFDHNPDAVYAFDLEGRFTSANPACAAVSGYAPAELLGTDFRDLVPPDELARVEASFMRALAGEAIRYQTVIVHRDGQLVDILVSNIPIVVGGAVVGVYGIARDITEALRAVVARRELAERLDLLLSSTGEAIYGLDAQGRCSFANRAAGELFGLDPGEMVGTYLHEVIHNRRPDGSPFPAEECALYGVLRSGEGVRLRSEYFWRQDGSGFAGACSSFPLSGGAGGAVVTVVDMTERLRFEQELRDREQELQRILDTSPMGIVQVDAQGQTLRWNQAAASLLGWAEEEVIGKVPPVFAQQARESFRAAIDSLMRGDAIDAMELRCARRDGREIDLVLSAAPLSDGQGRTAGVIGVFMDTTERKALEQQLRQIQKMDALGRLAGGMAHDFNNVLTSVLGYSDLLLEEPGLAPQVRADLEAVRAAARHGAGLTEKLLRFSRPVVSGDTTNDVNAAIAEVGRIVGGLRGAEIELALALDPTAGGVSLDPTSLQQVVMNLVVNASDAMPSGGLLTITTAADDPPPDANVDPAVEGWVRISVSDQGEGMDPAIRCRVFEPFFTTKELGEGTGLGLSVVYGIVRACGGSVAVESQPGRGTTVSVWLRATQEREALAPEPQRLPARARAGTAFVVEDDASVRVLIARVLRELGYAVVEFDGAVAAIAGAARTRIDLVVTDVRMPGMTGVELARHLRLGRPGLPVLFVSGYPADEGASRATRARPLLAKPFTRAELHEALEDALRWRS